MFQAARIQLDYDNDYSNKNYEIDDVDNQQENDVVVSPVTDEEETPVIPEDLTPQGEPMTREELKQIVDSFRGAMAAINLSPGQLFCRIKDRLVNSESEYSTYLGPKDGKIELYCV